MTKVIPTIGTWQMACDLLDWNHIPEGKDRCAKQDAGALGRGYVQTYSVHGCPRQRPGSPIAQRQANRLSQCQIDLGKHRISRISSPSRFGGIFLAATAIGKGSGSGDNSLGIPFG